MEKLNNENFETVVSKEEKLFIIKFFSPSCGPCHTMTPVFNKLHEDNPALGFYEVDTSESPEIAAHFGVRGVPFVAYCENREVLYNFTGVTPLADMQFVINNIDDEHFREHGEFEVPEPKKTSYWFEISIAAIVLAYLLLFVF